jgi:hypothetical protein
MSISENESLDTEECLELQQFRASLLAVEIHNTSVDFKNYLHNVPFAPNNLAMERGRTTSFTVSLLELKV